jgi:hypothetical protein
MHKISEISALEVSASGALIATASRFMATVWKTGQTLEDPLCLHHTKKMTVREPWSID